MKLKIAAWLYLSSPLWFVKLLPRSIGQPGSDFNKAVEREYNRRVNRKSRRANRKLIRN